MGQNTQQSTEEPATNPRPSIPPSPESKAIQNYNSKQPRLETLLRHEQ